MDSECWLRHVDVPEPATAIKIILWNKSDIPRAAGKKASKKFPQECQNSIYTILAHTEPYIYTEQHVSVQCYY